MKLAPETREILRQYKALINARRRENGQSALRTEQVIDEICYCMACQSAVYLCGQFIRQDGYGQ
ncbi:hypothetical protein K3295_003786 [Salmonella enterica subsp. enterica serovar Coeln]|nr:hypothetical protein [Salmonella enterica subsp. enterica serovar Coeln]HDC1791787.1 hypothetical protein [Salmonella enterica]EHX6213068.1 hypothetical protein [Salmonella enterica subsp. enterica serovar Coeln]EHX8198738.1 hypothetical protein [Salmonella enterica subsp. enterica serovar Coeln]EHY5816568.1 hypothetical protein [Salmonella enterica subsp. enterica serovar Coeln]